VADFGLEQQIVAAREAAEKAAQNYITVQEALEQAHSELAAAKAKLTRLERALAILNGEEEPASRAEVAVPQETAVPAPPPPPRPSRPAGPYDHVTCGGCLAKGTMSEVLRPTKNNTMVRLLVCSSCNNETYLG